MPILAAWGHGFTEAAFRRWWGRWRRRAVRSEPCHAELREIAGRGEDPSMGEVEVSPELGSWLVEVGGPKSLQTDDLEVTAESSRIFHF